MNPLLRTYTEPSIRPAVMMEIDIKHKQVAMGEVVPFGKRVKPGKNILCQNNHHKWRVVKSQQFDVKQGKLVTVEQCSRCEKTRHRLL